MEDLVSLLDPDDECQDFIPLDARDQDGRMKNKHAQERGKRD